MKATFFKNESCFFVFENTLFVVKKRYFKVKMSLLYFKINGFGIKMPDSETEKGNFKNEMAGFSLKKAHSNVGMGLFLVTPLNLDDEKRKVLNGKK